MDYEWDNRKADENERKHGIRFTEAVYVFDDPKAGTIEETFRGEERFITIGMDPLSRILVVVYTWRDETIRVISARKATAKERKQYSGGKTI